MEFHYDLLEETKAEIKKMSFFKENISLEEEAYEVIHDFEQAVENSFENDYIYDGEDGLTWVDILEKNMSKVWKIIYQQKDYAELSKMVSDVKVEELGDIGFTISEKDVIEEIKAELGLCAKSRFVCGRENLFFEAVFRAYCFGGMPCGWNNGKIIVYVPGN